MARKHYKPEEIVAKLRQVDVLVSQGQSVRRQNIRDRSGLFGREAPAALLIDVKRQYTVVLAGVYQQLT